MTCQRSGDFRPAASLLQLEEIQINGDFFWWEGCQQFLHARVHFGCIEGCWNVTFDATFAVVWDFECIEERGQHVRTALHEPDLQHVFANAFGQFHLQAVNDESGLLFARLLCDVNWAQFTLLGQCGDGGLVNILFIIAHPIDDLMTEGGGDFLKELVSLHVAG